MKLGDVLDRGDLLFTKKVSRGPEKGALTIHMKTPLAVLLVGGTSNCEWTDNTLDRSLLSLGLIYRDDIEECLGEVAFRKLQKFLDAKYVKATQAGEK